MCDPLKNTLFRLAATDAKTCCAMLRRGLKKMQIRLGDQKTIFIAQKVCDFVGKVEISLYSKTHFGAMLVGFGHT